MDDTKQSPYGLGKPEDTEPWPLLSSRRTSISFLSTWYALSFASQRMDYATMNGHIIASDQPTAYGVNIFSYAVLPGLSWSGANWHINVYFKQDIAPFYFISGVPDMPLYENPACAGAQNNFANIVSEYSQIEYFPATNAADGCLAIAKWSGVYGPAPSSPYLWFLDRFGILYPINTAAFQESYPDAPHANVYVQHLAQQLAKLPGVVVNLG